VTRGATRGWMVARTSYGLREAGEPERVFARSCVQIVRALPHGSGGVSPAGAAEEVEEEEERPVFKHQAISAQTPCAQCPVGARGRGLSIYNAFSKESLAVPPVPILL